jgi:hypothetical protein
MLKIKRGYLEGRSDGCFGSSGDRLWQRWRSLHHIRLVRSWYLQRGSQFWRSLTGNGHLFNAMERGRAGPTCNRRILFASKGTQGF